MSCDLVTGLQAETHISAEQDGLLNVGLFGPGNYLLDTQDRLPATITSANTVIIGTGDFLMQGRHVTCQEPETLTLTSGTTGFSRIDLIVARYTKDAITGIEDVSLAVLEGEAVQNGTPVEPSYTTGNIITGGALLNELPIYRVQINDLVPQDPVMLLTTCLQTIYALQVELAKKITADKIADGAIVRGKIANNAIDSSKIADGSINAVDLANGAVIAEKIANNSITNEKIANGSIDSAKLANYSITNEKIMNGSINADKIADGSILVSKLNQNIQGSYSTFGAANGWYYIKFESGLAICYRNITSNATIKKAWGSLYSSPEHRSYDYPFPFVEEPAVSVTAKQADGAAWALVTENVSTTASPYYFLASAKPQEVRPTSISIIAVGRWK